MPHAILIDYLYAIPKMKLDKLCLFSEEGRSEEEIEKLRIILAFYERLPSVAMQAELLFLMDAQPCMAPAEFDLRLDTFISKVKAAPALTQESPSAVYVVSGQVH